MREIADHGDENVLHALVVQRARQMMMIDHVVSLVRSVNHRDHVLAEQLRLLLRRLCSRQRLRFSFTSLIPDRHLGRAQRKDRDRLKDRLARIRHGLKPRVSRKKCR